MTHLLSCDWVVLLLSALQTDRTMSGLSFRKPVDMYSLDL